MKTLALEYPFPATPLSMEELKVVSDTLAEAEGEFGLFATRPSLTAVAQVFLRHCSPPEPGVEALQLMSRLLHIVLHFNDRIDPITTAREAQCVWRALASSADVPGPDAGPAWHAARRVHHLLSQTMQSRPGDLIGFLHLFRINLAAFVWANSDATGPRASVEYHLLLRTETISAAAFLRMWGLLTGLSTESQLAFGLPLQTLERLSARVQALANDLRSVERDEREGQANVVSLLEPNDAEAGWVRALRMHDDSLSQLVTHSAGLLERSPPDDVVRYVHFIQSCTRGNNAAMTELSNRYV